MIGMYLCQCISMDLILLNTFYAVRFFLLLLRMTNVIMLSPLSSHSSPAFASSSSYIIHFPSMTSTYFSSVDDQGYLFISGRSKEIINRGGETISPFEIEEAVQQHPSIKEVLAFSAPHLQVRRVE